MVSSVRSVGATSNVPMASDKMEEDTVGKATEGHNMFITDQCGTGETFSLLYIAIFFRCFGENS